METNEVMTLSELNESLVSSLQCQICFSLMAAEIYQCINGHHVCNECKKKISKCPTCRGQYIGTRNFLGEEIANLISLLDISKTESSLQSQGTECEFISFRFRFGSVSGDWKTSSYSLIEHLVNIRSGDCAQKLDAIPYNCDKFFEQTTQIKVLGQLFWWYYIQDPESGIYHTFQYIGLPQDSSQYKFEIQYSHPWGCPKVSYSNFTCSLDSDIYTLCRGSETFHLSFRRFESMLQNNIINFDFNISKNGS